jgi:glycosyltransferase involved in cell wall biosynthesis
MTRADVLVVSGIWPPDVGGPASHGPAVADFLTRRGHRVHAFASVARPPAPQAFPVTTTSRLRPLPVRWLDAEAKLLRLVRSAAVVYATGLYHRAAVACRAHRVPLVLKLVNDPAYERARNLGWFGGTLEEFQAAAGDRRMRVLRRLRDAAVGQAARIVVPSRYLARIVEGWGVGAERVEVVPNPAPPLRPHPDRAELRHEHGMTGPTAAFVGRFVLQKNLPLLVGALREVPDEVSLVLVGDGPERDAVASAVERAGVGPRVRMLGAVARDEALRWMQAADVTVLPSSWENFPHAAVESLSVGTPVVGTTVGGVPEIVEHGVNGLLSPPGDERALADGLRAALLDGETSARLREGAAATGDRYAPDAVFARLEAIILGARR